MNPSPHTTTDQALNTRIEHVNVTVADPERTAAMLVDLFGWSIRWKGESKLGGHTIHVGQPGTGDDYLAIYTTPERPEATARSTDLGGLNHIGLVVDDLNQAERRIVAAGYQTYSHGDYIPGRRFYFDVHGIEFEIISYNEKSA